jgi:hypothetical protein
MQSWRKTHSPKRLWQLHQETNVSLSFFFYQDSPDKNFESHYSNSELKDEEKVPQETGGGGILVRGNKLPHVLAFCHCDNIWIIIKRRKDLFWFIASSVSVHGLLMLVGQR